MLAAHSRAPKRAHGALAALLALVGLTILYLGPLKTRFLNDDYLFLEEARTRPLLESLTSLGALGNYYRPLSRQIYFEALAPIAGGHPFVFHLVDFGLFVGALLMLADLLLALLPTAGAVAGLLVFALLPFQRVDLMWVSCAQDLLALVGVLATVALYRRGRRGPALLASLVALASKEAALPLPIALAAWSLWVDRARPRDVWARVAPFAGLALAWGAVAMAMRARHAAAAPLRFSALDFVAGYAHMIQSLLGLEQADGLGASLLSHPPAWLPLVLIAPLALWAGARASASRASAIAREAAATESHPPAPNEDAGSATPPVHAVLILGAVWLAAFGFVTGPVAYSWSAYFYTTAAVGGAMLVGAAFRSARTLTLLVLLTGLLWLHAGASAVRSFAVSDSPWVWTSHLTSFYFERAAALTDTLSRQLMTLEPKPAHDARLFFATLPPYAGFQMGNGALVRALYREPGIQSHFYSQFSESTAADRPCRFYYWNGEALEALYRNPPDPFFQVGSDLLLLDRPSGAAHAFRRGLAAGEDRRDHLYWLGWAELWRGRRANAEQAWHVLGAQDDSLRWLAHVRAAHEALRTRDTLETRRQLMEAIQYGMGRPEAHSVLGTLMTGKNLKYALLELKVASWLDAGDGAARRELALGLVRVRLDDAARTALEQLKLIYPEWRSDSLVVRALRTLDARAPGPPAVASY